MRDGGDGELDLGEIEDWKRFCESLTNRPRDEEIAGGGWVVSASTPPPTFEDPLARIPLEQAVKRYEQARDADRSEAREALLRAALEWLDHPHPRSSAAVLRLVAEQRRQIEEMLAG